jgi:hypothetical protein
MDLSNCTLRGRSKASQSQGRNGSPSLAILSCTARISAASGKLEAKHELGFTRPGKSKVTPEILSKASLKVTRAAMSYRKLLTLTSTIQIGKTFTSVTPNELTTKLESEADSLEASLNRADSAFSKKRIGTNADWALLVRLQDFVEEFALRWGAYMRVNAARRLGESDLMDLLEAGQTAWGDDKELIWKDADSSEGPSNVLENGTATRVLAIH